MGLQKAFTSGVETIFKTLQETVKDSLYIVSNDDGFTETPFETSTPMRAILDKFTQEDVEKLSFHELIQPTDTKALIPGADVTVTMRTSNILRVEDRDFTIVAFVTDPFMALYTLLLRDT